MAVDHRAECFDAFPYAERQNRRLWLNGREMPGWYPSLDQIFPMVLCRVVPVANVIRPATYCRVLGHVAQPGRPAVWIGGYQATLLMDQSGWPVFRVERIFIPPQSELPLKEVLAQMLGDGEEIAKGLGVRSFQVALLEMEDDALPGFPAVGSPFGPLADSRLGEPLADLGYSPLIELGYYRSAVAGGGAGRASAPPAGGCIEEGRPYCWEGDDVSVYHRLWAEYCERNHSDIHFLITRLYPLDPRLQHHMEQQDRLSRIRFIGGEDDPAGLVSWYPDIYPQLLSGEAAGPQVRLKLTEYDPQAVTAAKVLKCLAPRAEESVREDLLTAGLRWAAAEAIAAHPRLEWIQAGPVPQTDQPLLDVLQREGFERFGRLVCLERLLSRFKR
jgi:hypothetical protein